MSNTKFKNIAYVKKSERNSRLRAKKSKDDSRRAKTQGNKSRTDKSVKYSYPRY